jgi:hypothetical protein
LASQAKQSPKDSKTDNKLIRSHGTELVMRKRSAYRPRQTTTPMLVNRGLIEQEIETRERMLVEAFAGGWATTEHFDNIADMRNVMTLAAAHKNDQSALNACEAMRIPMGNLRDRYAQTGRLGVSGDELRMLRAFVDQYRDFWIRQPVKLYLAACDALNRAHAIGLKDAA